jgi:hypothetical protein
LDLVADWSDGPNIGDDRVKIARGQYFVEAECHLRREGYAPKARVGRTNTVYQRTL